MNCTRIIKEYTHRAQVAIEEYPFYWLVVFIEHFWH